MNSQAFQAWCASYSSTVPPKTLIMGIINLTPDSFSQDGFYSKPEQALQHALHLIEAGADIVDIGGESSRPGAVKISLQEELDRVMPVIELIRRESETTISIDTTKPELMTAAVSAGAGLINDINALQTPEALAAAARLQVPVCLMHKQGEPATMQNNPVYPTGIIETIQAFFAERIQQCEKAGLDRRKIILDPGFGFGKTIQHNLKLLHDLDKLLEFDRPLLLGVSRKSTIGTLLDKSVDERMIGSLAVAVYSALKGVGVIRTHDVDETRQALQMLNFIAAADSYQQG